MQYSIFACSILFIKAGILTTERAFLSLLAEESISSLNREWILFLLRTSNTWNMSEC